MTTDMPPDAPLAPAGDLRLDLVPHGHRCGCGREFKCTAPACIGKVIPCTVCRIEAGRGGSRRKGRRAVAAQPSSATTDANLPSIAAAKLPASYEAAKIALAECSRIDECKNWANKAEALAVSELMEATTTRGGRE